MNNFNEPTEDQVKKSFHAFDSDRNGSISASEMQIVLGKCGQKVTQAQCVELIKLFDKNSTGVMEYLEFQQMVAEAVIMKKRELKIPPSTV
jgi:Ca2+-binding EF-hand superfamily protein